MKHYTFQLLNFSLINILSCYNLLYFSSIHEHTWKNIYNDIFQINVQVHLFKYHMIELYIQSHGKAFW